MSRGGALEPRGGLVDRSRFLELLQRILQGVGTVRDAREILAAAVREGMRQLPYAWMGVTVTAPDEIGPRILASVPSGAGALRVGEPVRQPSGFWQAIDTRRPFVRERLDEGGPLWEDAALRDIGVVAYAAFPLEDGDEVIGTLNVGRRDHQGMAGDVALMTRLAEFLVSAVRAARLIEETQQGLTRLHERAAAPPPDLLGK